MDLRIVSPTKAFVDNVTTDELEMLEKNLTYTNTSVSYLIKKHHNNRRWKNSSSESWEDRLEQLKKELKTCLLFKEGDKRFIRPGSIPYLTIPANVINEVVYPEPKKIAWEKVLPFELHEYQDESWQNLLNEKHANVSITTGGGKSAIILKLCRELGLPISIVVPSKNLFYELLEKFEYHFGKKNVGRFGDGKKVLGKRFTICIGDSLTNIVPDSEEWKFFSRLSGIITDESHQWGAETLDGVCHGVFADVPYRFFFSGTQVRGDGSDKLLHSIIGKTVYSLPTDVAVKMGVICPHEFRIVELKSSNPNMVVDDVMGMKRLHLFENKNIATFIAKLATIEATVYRRQTLVLVEQLNQISSLLKLLKANNVPTVIAHSESSKKKLEPLGLEKVDVMESVEKFNKGEAMVILGTSCISTGTNFYPPHNVFNWVGGSSEVKTKQGAVGRSTRFSKQNPFKNEFSIPKEKSIIWDVDVIDIPILKRHTEIRIEFYKQSGTEIKFIKLK